MTRLLRLLAALALMSIAAGLTLGASTLLVLGRPGPVVAFGGIATAAIVWSAWAGATLAGWPAALTARRRARERAEVREIEDTAEWLVAMAGGHSPRAFTDVQTGRRA